MVCCRQKLAPALPSCFMPLLLLPALVMPSQLESYALNGFLSSYLLALLWDQDPSRRPPERPAFPVSLQPASQPVRTRALRGAIPIGRPTAAVVHPTDDDAVTSGEIGR